MKRQQHTPKNNQPPVNNGQASFFFQPKLTINQPKDVYEQEADAMADKVMRMPQPFIQVKPMPVTFIQRKCTHCEEEEKAQRKEINGEEATADASLENYVGGLSGSGQLLSNEVRNFYEPRFGYNFSNVKVHTDSVAAKSAQSVNALAYTSGNNIVFNTGQFSPDTDTGKKLLGHELTHVIQQAGNNSAPEGSPIQRVINDRPLSYVPGTGHTVGLRWYIEPENLSPIILQNNTVRFELKTAREDVTGYEVDGFTWKLNDTEQPPEFGIMDENENILVRRVSDENDYPATAAQQFRNVGHRKIFFRGNPCFSYFTGCGSEIMVTYDIDVRPNVSGTELAATSSSVDADIDELSNEDNSLDELGVIIRRLAIRSAYEVLSANKREVINLRDLYRDSDSDLRLQQILNVYRIYEELNNTIASLMPLTTINPAAGITESRTRQAEHDITQIENGMRVIIQAYPEIGAYERNRGFFESPTTAPISGFRDFVLEKLYEVMTDIDNTRYNLATNDMNILEVRSMVDHVAEEYGSGNTRITQSISRMYEDRSYSELMYSLAFGSGQIALLFIPGIGPYLSFALGLVQAGVSWEHAADMSTAANTGLASGIVTDEEASSAAFQAVLDTVFSVIDGIEAGAGAIRAISALRRTGTAVGEEVAEESIEAGARTGTHTASSEIIGDSYEVSRGLDMRGHMETPDRLHHLEAYLDGTCGRCSPVANGEHCPLLQTVYNTVLSRRTVITAELEALSERFAALTSDVPSAMMEELTAVEMRLRRLQEIDVISGAPASYSIREVGFNFADTVPLNSGRTLLEFPNGARAWRDADGMIVQEGVVSENFGRMGTERRFYTGRETGLAGYEELERAHTWPQRWGWESPFSILYAPPFVNQTLQNHGIEIYIERLRDLLPVGQELIVRAESAAASDSRLLEHIEYFIDVLSNGERIEVATYRINVSGPATALVTDAQPLHFLTGFNSNQQAIISAIEQLLPSGVRPAILDQAVHHLGL